MAIEKFGIILVGHGGLPSDCPDQYVSKLKRLESQRRKNNTPPSAEESELDKLIREWPRTKETDPYKTGLEAVAEKLKRQTEGLDLEVAYNEFCSPTIKEATKKLVENGANNITIICTMFTPGGSHSEIEIPEEVCALNEIYPDVKIDYAWPFDLEHVAGFLKGHLLKHLETREA